MYITIQKIHTWLLTFTQPHDDFLTLCTVDVRTVDVRTVDVLTMFPLKQVSVRVANLFSA